MKNKGELFYRKRLPTFILQESQIDCLVGWLVGWLVGLGWLADLLIDKLINLQG